jgi:hypothetical protein
MIIVYLLIKITKIIIIQMTNTIRIKRKRRIQSNWSIIMQIVKLIINQVIIILKTHQYILWINNIFISIVMSLIAINQIHLIYYIKESLDIYEILSWNFSIFILFIYYN